MGSYHKKTFLWIFREKSVFVFNFISLPITKLIYGTTLKQNLRKYYFHFFFFNIDFFSYLCSQNYNNSIKNKPIGFNLTSKQSIGR